VSSYKYSQAAPSDFSQLLTERCLLLHLLQELLVPLLVLIPDDGADFALVVGVAHEELAALLDDVLLEQVGLVEHVERGHREEHVQRHLEHLQLPRPHYVLGFRA